MKNMRRRGRWVGGLLGVVGVLGGVCTGWAAGAGTSTGDFLSLGAGSRLAGLGNAGTALIDDASSLYWNPAAMTRVNKQSALLMHTSYLESSNFSQGYYTHSFGTKGSLGVGLNYFSSGDLDRKDTSGADDGSFSPNDMSLAIGYARKVGPVSLGAGLKYVKSTIVDSASTFTTDFGVLSDPLVNKKLRVSATATNVGGSMKYDKESEDLPREFRVGGSYFLIPKLSLVADMGVPKSGDSYLAGGAEFTQTVKDAWAFAGRAGYSTRTAGDVSGLTGVTFGLGVSRGTLGFDYALVPQGDLGMTHWIALVYKK